MAFARGRSIERMGSQLAGDVLASHTGPAMAYQGSVFLPDADATDRFGEALAQSLRPGDTILLAGQIGAGKTCLARAAISALHIRMGQPAPEVPSPTFTLVQSYELPGIQVWHADLYRLTEASEVTELGLEEALGTDIVLVEWPDRLQEEPDGALALNFEVQDGGRQVALRSTSDLWQGRISVIESADA